MNKLLIEVHVPAIGRTFDVSIPYNAKVLELLPLITTAVVQLSDGMFVPNSTVLCDGNTGAIYGNNMSVGEMQLRNGSRLILI